MTTFVGAIITKRVKEANTFNKLVRMDFTNTFSFTVLKPHVNPNNPITNPTVIHTLPKSDSG